MKGTDRQQAVQFSPQPRKGEDHESLGDQSDPTHPIRILHGGLYITRLLQDSARNVGGNAAVAAFPRP